MKSALTVTRTDEIIRLHDEVIGALKTSLEKAIRIGELLTEQKKSLAHGAFLPWVKESLPFTDRTARNYMRLHRERDRLKTEMVSDLKGAYKMLGAPKAETWEQIMQEYGFNCSNCRLPQGYPPSCLLMLQQDKSIDMAALILRLYQSVKEKRQDEDTAHEYKAAQDYAAEVMAEL
jgi:hypothetical protein